MSKYLLCQCDEQSTTDHSQEAVSWGEVAVLTHAEQVHRYGWCGCEDSEAQYEDCPTK